MKLSLIQKNKDKTAYHLGVTDTDVYMLNALRRATITLVPTMAIETVEFRQNSSVMYDEILAHRLGLVPLTTDLKNYEMITKPEDEESLKCVSKLTLSVKGPKMVYSGDLKSSDPGIAPVYEEMPLVKLTKGQEVKFEAKAVLGLGKDHMKWSPGIVFYKHKPIVSVSKSADVEALKESLPEDSAVTISGSNVKVDDAKLATTSYFDAFMGETVVEGVTVDKKEDEFVLYAESFGQLSVKEMLTTAADALKERLSDLNDSLKK